MDDIQWWVWLIIAVAAVLVIGALIASFGPRRSAERRRSEAAELRERALAAQEEVRVRETEAASTRAKVEEAKVRADELERHAREQERSAAEIKDDARGDLEKADRIDPDVTDSDLHSDARHERVVDGEGADSERPVDGGLPRTDRRA